MAVLRQVRETPESRVLNSADYITWSCCKVLVIVFTLMVHLTWFRELVSYLTLPRIETRSSFLWPEKYTLNIRSCQNNKLKFNYHTALQTRGTIIIIIIMSHYTSNCWKPQIHCFHLTTKFIKLVWYNFRVSRRRHICTCKLTSSTAYIMCIVYFKHGFTLLAQATR